MKAIRMLLYTVLFAAFAACGQVEPPAASNARELTSAPPAADEPDAASSASKAVVAPASLQTCLHHCQPDDLDCVDCCHCLANGGTPSECCI